MIRRYTAKELKALSTISSGQFDNLKIDTGNIRVWICRCGRDDGMFCDDLITVEQLENNRWITISEYPG